MRGGFLFKILKFEFLVFLCVENRRRKTERLSTMIEVRQSEPFCYGPNRSSPDCGTAGDSVRYSFSVGDKW